MAIPAELDLSDPEFWATYFFESDDEYLEDDEHTASFDVGGGHSVDVEISDGYFDLGVRSPDEDEAVSIGWDDEAHFHPHVLRWAELDLICRAAALRDPALRHPGPGLALLGRFLVLDTADDVDVVTAMLHAAFTGLRPADTAGFWPDARKHGTDRADFRAHGVVWRLDQDGDHVIVDQTPQLV